MTTVHYHWSGDDGDYLLPHQDVPEKFTNVVLSVVAGATLLFVSHGDKELKARHAGEEQAVLQLVDIKQGEVLDAVLANSKMGNKEHIHRALGRGKKGGENDRKKWSSIYLQEGDVFFLGSGEIRHAAMKSSMHPFTAVMLQYQRVLKPED